MSRQLGKPRLNLAFSDMWGHDNYRFNPQLNYFLSLFQLKYDTRIVANNADLLIFSSYGQNYKNITAKKKLYFSNEIIGDINRPIQDYDAQIGAVRFAEPSRFVFFPHFVIYINWFNEPMFLRMRSPSCLLTLEQVNYSQFRTKSTRANYFCTIYSNPVEGRVETIKYLSRHFKFDNHGRLLNNTGGPLGGTEYEKLVVLSSYKFSLASENIISPHYVSEKLLHCMATGTVPVYLGSDLFKSYFNEKAVLDAKKFENRELVEKIGEIANDERFYRDFLDVEKLNMNAVLQFSPLLILSKLEQAVSL